MATTKLNLVNDNVVALSLTATESLSANTITGNFSGNGVNITSVDAATLGGQDSAYHLNYNNHTNTPDLTVYGTKADAVASNNAVLALIDKKMAVSNAVATFAPINNATLTGTTGFGSLTDGLITITGFVDEDNMASNSAVLIPTQQSVKAYVDQHTDEINSTFTLAADVGANNLFTTGQTLTFAGNTGVTTTVSDNQISFAIAQDVGTSANVQFNTVSANVIGTATQANSIKVIKNESNQNFYFTFVDSNNTSAEYEALYTDTALNLNPFTNIVAGGGIDMVAYFISGVEITASATELNKLDGVTATTTELNYIDGVTSNIQTQLDAKQGTITGGSGIAVSSSTVSVDLTTAEAGSLTVSGYSSPQSFTNGTYTIYTGFSGTISGSAGSSTMTFAANSQYNIYRDSVDSRILAFNTTENSWFIAYSPSGSGTISDGSTMSVSTQAWDKPTASSVTISGKNSPDASGWSEGTYSASSPDPFLAFDNGKLHVDALDEDDMSSDSATKLATQQSIKAYVDTTAGANETHIDNLATLSGVAKDSTSLGTFTGSTISDSRTVKQALQELETNLESVSGGNAAAASVATQANTADSTHFLTFVSDNNPSLTQEVIKTDAGISYNPSSDVLTVTGSISANVTGDLTGNADTATVSTKVKTSSASDNSTHFLTFVADNNGSPTEENVFTDAGVSYNPSTNILAATAINPTTLYVNGTEVTSTAAELNILSGVTADASELNVLDGVTAFVDEDNMASDSATSIPSQQSVKAYVDTTVGAVDLQIGTAGDSGTGTVSTSQSLTIAGTSNEIETSASGQSVTVGLPSDVTITTSLTSPVVKTANVAASDGTAALTIDNTTGKVHTEGDLHVNGTLDVDRLTSSQANATIVVTADLVVTGNVVISGNTKIISSEELVISDSVIRVNSDGELVSAGIEAIVGANTESILFNPTTQRWEFSDDIYTAGKVTFGSLDDGVITITAFVDEDNMVSDSATLVPTQQSVKAYVDNENTSQTNTLQANIDEKMAVSNVVTIQTNLENSISTKLAVANATLQTITTTGSTTTDSITVGGLVSAGLTYPSADGNNLQAIVTDGSGNLSFANVAASPIATTGTFTPTKLDDLTGNGNTVYQLASGGTAYAVANQNSLLVSLNGVIQEPGVSYTVSGTTLVFTSPVQNDDVIDFVTDFAPSGTFTITNDTINVGTVAATRVTADTVVATGNITANAYNTTSDMRLKSNIADANPSSEILDAIQVRQYDWKHSGDHEDFGFVAQELNDVYARAVSPGKGEHPWTVDFSKLVPLLVKEVQDLRARVAELEAK